MIIIVATKITTNMNGALILCQTLLKEPSCTNLFELIPLWSKDMYYPHSQG